MLGALASETRLTMYLLGGKYGNKIGKEGQTQNNSTLRTMEDN